MKCSKCRKEEDKTDMNEGSICDECYAKYEKKYKISLIYPTKIDFEIIKAFTDEEAIAIAEQMYEEGAHLSEKLINKTWELINVETDNRIVIGE